MNMPTTASKKSEAAAARKTSAKKLRLAAVGDIHVRRDQHGAFLEMFRQVSQQADVLLLCGDLTETGLMEEAQNLVQDLSAITIPILGILGNHEYQHNQEQEIRRLLSEAKVQFLDDNPVTIQGVGFAGTKGFCGGFGRHMLSSFGEPGIKRFVQETVDDVLSLEHSLRMLGDQRKVVVLHYAPIAQTIQGEPPEIFPFLGNSRLEESINQFDDVQVVFHGHAHSGQLVGYTSKEVPVYNCCYPLCQKLVAEKKLPQPYVVVEI